MDPTRFFTASRTLIVAGKGGVGKTTVTAALGVAASRVGVDTLLVDVEGKRGLAALFGHPGLDDRDLVVIDPDDPATPPGSGRLSARTIAADTALSDYLTDHGLVGFGRALERMHVLETLATSTPGLRDLIVLGRIRQLADAPGAPLVIVDAPASGHARSFLRAARGLQASIDTGPIRAQADEVVAMLTDPTRAQVLLVTLPEESPVNELVETAFALEDEVGIVLGPCVVNAVHPVRTPVTDAAELVAAGMAPRDAGPAADAARWWVRRTARETQQRNRLHDELPLEQLVLPRRFRTRLDPSDVDALADHLLRAVDALLPAGPG